MVGRTLDELVRVTDQAALVVKRFQREGIEMFALIEIVDDSARCVSTWFSPERALVEMERRKIKLIKEKLARVNKEAEKARKAAELPQGLIKGPTEDDIEYTGYLG